MHFQNNCRSIKIGKKIGKHKTCVLLLEKNTNIDLDDFDISKVDVQWEVSRERMTSCDVLMTSLDVIMT